MTRWSSLAWIRAFKAVGGIAWVSDDGRFSFGWHIKGYTLAQHIEARRMCVEIENDQRRLVAVMKRVAALN